MRTFALSDIHGNFSYLLKALDTISFKKTDRLIIIGDLIDRGKNSKEVLDLVSNYIEKGFDITVLLGNHEKMLLDAFINNQRLNHWISNGGDTTLASFGVKTIEEIPTKYIRFINSFKYHYEVDNFIFTHASLNMLIENPFEDINHILWEREPYNFLNEKWLGNRILIHGHTPTSRDEIINSVENKEKIICIDNGSYFNDIRYGSLCVLQIDNMELNFIK